jgi:signal transduction histidine kinase
MRARIQRYGAEYVLFGIFCILNYCVPFFMWAPDTDSPFPGLTFRLIGAALCFFLIVKDYLPNKVARFLPLYWYGTLLFCLPFFTTYMLLVNDFSLFWIFNVVLGIFILALLVDSLSFLMILILGSTFATLLYNVFNDTVSYPHDFESVFLGFYMLIFSIIVSLTFSRRRETFNEERLKAVEVAGGTIAHEMRTPLSAVLMNGKMIQMTLADLRGLEESLTPQNKRTFSHGMESLNITAEALIKVSKESYKVIDALMTNLKQDFTCLETSELSMSHVIENALQGIVLKGDESLKIKLHLEDDFTVTGNQDLLAHVFFNLIKNSLYFIRLAEKGEIFITLERGSSVNRVIFKDTGPGIKKEHLPRLFTPFYSNSPQGTGLGLAFCRKVTDSMNGSIKATSDFGEYTTFTLEFPRE